MTTIKLRRGTAAQWASANPTLAQGEPGYETDTGLMRIGDGSTAFVDLPGFLNEDALSSTNARAIAGDEEYDGTPQEAVDARVPVAGAGVFATAYRKPTVVFLGDSNTQANIAAGGTENGANHAALVTKLLGGRIRALAFKGISGDTCADMAARLQADVINLAPGWCYILAGTNDADQGDATAAQTVLHEDIILPLRAAGIEPVLCTIPPNEDEPAEARRWNAFLRQYATAQGIILADYYNAVVDPSTAGWVTEYRNDGTHFNPLSHLAAARAGVAAWSPHLPPAAIPIAQDGSTDLNLVPNAVFLGGADGPGRPTGWSSGQANGGGYGTMSFVDGGEDIVGNWFQIEKTGATAYNVNVVKSAGFTVGDRVAFMFQLEAESLAGGQTVTMRAVFRNGSAAAISRLAPVSALGVDVERLTAYMEGTVPAGTADIRVEVSLPSAGTGTVRIGQVTLINLTSGGLLI